MIYHLLFSQFIDVKPNQLEKLEAAKAA